MRLIIAVAALALAAAPAAAERITRGQLVLENVPDAPAEVSERLNQYVSARAAGFRDWLPGGGVLIATRFGDAVQLHAVAEPMGARTQLTFHDEPVAGGSVRPGGAEILYARDRGGDERFAGFLFDPQSGEAREFTDPDTRNQSLIWSDDGRLAAWSYVPADSPDYDIFVADPAAPQSRRLVLDGEGALFPVDFSADGEQLLVQRYISIAASKLFVLDLASGAVSELAADRSAAYGGGEFTPDGEAVVAISDLGESYTSLVRIPLAGGEPAQLTPGVPWDIEAFDLSPDGRTLAYVVNVAGSSELRLMDVRNGRVLRGPRTPPAVISDVKFDHAGRSVGFSLNSAASADVYSWDVRRRQLTRWTQSETGGLDPALFVEPRFIEWESFDGLAITGFVYTPRAPGPHPVVIYIHGGPESQFRPRFSSTIQYWVNELGLAVIAPNVRGSDGYGKAFLALDNGERREDAVRDIGALLDWIAASDEFDAARVMVYGGSYGGYMALASMTHYADRLAGAVDVVGISNFITFLENTSGYRRDLRRAEYGDERDPEMRALFERISPLNNAEAITKPLLIVHGANDPRVPASEAEQLLARVRANGGEAWLLLALDEGHGFRKRANQQAQREAEAMFFHHVLGLGAGAE